MPKKVVKNERTALIPSTTTLKLFVYPGKDGFINRYSTQYCVGFETERSHAEGTFVSQLYITAWDLDYSKAVQKFEYFRDRLNCAEQ